MTWFEVMQSNIFVLLQKLVCCAKKGCHQKRCLYYLLRILYTCYNKDETFHSSKCKENVIILYLDNVTNLSRQCQQTVYPRKCSWQYVLMPCLLWKCSSELNPLSRVPFLVCPYINFIYCSMLMLHSIKCTHDQHKRYISPKSLT